jgi:hypothetical protein
VGQLSVEFLQTRMNKELLEQIAFRTGGRFYTPNTAAALTSDAGQSVRFSSKESFSASEIEVWNWRYLAFLIIALFATEWFLRKRSGML